MSNLKNYYTQLKSAQEKEKKMKNSDSICRIDNPKDACKTLWIPVFSGNRTATFDLNHKLDGFNEKGELWGSNGNCGTSYRILEVPNNWDEDNLLELKKIVAKKMNKSDEYPIDRVLKADDRIDLIVESIEELS